MIKTQMTEYLTDRYQTQCKRWPMMRNDISLDTYVKANLEHMVKLTYWKEKRI